MLFASFCMYIWYNICNKKLIYHIETASTVHFFVAKLFSIKEHAVAACALLHDPTVV